MELSEIIEHLNSNEEASKGVMEALKEKGYVIRSQDEETSFLGKVTKQVEEDKIKPRLKEIYSQFDKDIEEATGLKKDPNEKSYEFAKRAGSSLKKEIEELKAASTGSADYSTKIAEKEKEYKKILEEKDSIINQMKGEITTSQKRSLLQETYAPIKAKIGSQPSYFSEYEKQVMNEVLKNSTIVEEDGQKLYVVTGEDGEPLKKNFQFVLVEKALEEKFKDAIDNGKNLTGAGTGKAPAKQVKSESTGLVRPASVSNKVELRKWLEGEKGLAAGSPEFRKAYAELREGLSTK